jgi:hypothetical protein
MSGLHLHVLAKHQISYSWRFKSSSIILYRIYGVPTHNFNKNKYFPHFYLIIFQANLVCIINMLEVQWDLIHIIGDSHPLISNDWVSHTLYIFLAIHMTSTNKWYKSWIKIYNTLEHPYWRSLLLEENPLVSFQDQETPKQRTSKTLCNN